MIPKTDNKDLELITYPSNTYKLDTINKNIKGYIDDIEAVKQAIYKILNTERYDYLIYSWNYGFEYNDLIGETYSYIIVELESRIKEALLQDDRIESVNNFKFNKNFDYLTVEFTVTTKYGDIESLYNFSI